MGQNSNDLDNLLGKTTINVKTIMTTAMNDDDNDKSTGKNGTWKTDDDDDDDHDNDDHDDIHDVKTIMTLTAIVTMMMTATSVMVINAANYFLC